MKRLVTIQKIAIILITIVIVVCCLTYNYEISPVDKTNNEMIKFEVTENQTLSTLGSSLKEANLIHSELFYKIYIKLHNITSLEAGIYELNSSMSLKEITDTLESGATYNPDVIKITFPEGKQIKQIAKIIEENTNHSQEEVLSLATNNSYIKSLIKKYWFLDDDILDEKIYYPLEGYLFPDTYEFMNKDVSIETIFETMLNQTNIKLSNLKEDLEQSNYSIHEIITLASMIQSEGNNIDDFKNMASIFLTRLKNGMKLQSCASSYYGDHKIMGEDEFLDSYLKKNAYNTYVVSSLPAGPISNPGLSAIEAVLTPSDEEYLYFASDKNMKVYFSKTLKEHESIIAKLKKAGNWYGS